jgi:hypothetical protein
MIFISGLPPIFGGRLRRNIGIAYLNLRSSALWGAVKFPAPRSCDFGIRQCFLNIVPRMTVCFFFSLQNHEVEFVDQQ